MKRFPVRPILLTTVAAISLAACGDETSSISSVSSVKEAPAVAGSASTSPGKPTAPISIDYEVLGKPIVGLPVAINIEVHSSQDLGPVSVQYSIDDTSALLFQEGQVQRLENMEFAELASQQLAVVPQREGRLYVNVAAEVQTPGGSMIKSMAIPIQVGSSPNRPEINGELVEGPDGETVISMPAQQN